MAVLSIVATPIGNLEDISLRALRTLKEVDFVLCEDTRVTRKLLDHYQISVPTISYHQHSGGLKVDKILSLLNEGRNLALVTDAGTPGISDPGGKLISLVREELGASVKIETIPGSSALTAALSLAGAGFDHFLFLGFLPNKKGRQTLLKEIALSHYPIIVYESKHRILKLVAELIKLEEEFKINLQIAVFRELTKMFESSYFGRPSNILEKLSVSASETKGEMVVAIRKA